MVSIKIDNISVQVKKNSTILEACDHVGVIVPRFCFHDKLKIAGNCRMCIVEIEKFPKPISSCTMNVNEGMAIFTKTPMVKRAQESVLEFLLINHPLDCPICDQGGECDLQDQLLFFGSDSSKFFHYKRGVEDKNCSLLIKTIMTRCIHCTRCVRFLTEVAGENNLGVLGRSNQSEIGLYFDNDIESEFSGNVIDLCPVGALTSKPYSFRGRTWELTNSKSLDILDGLGSNILVSLKGSDILRVLPNINESINSEWISDKTRFSYDSFDYLRIKSPWSKQSGSFISWKQAFHEFKQAQSYENNNGLSLILGDFIDNQTAISAQEFVNRLGSSSIFSENSNSCTNQDFREHFSFHGGIHSIGSYDLCLLVGADLRKESSSLNLKVRQQVVNGDLEVSYIGPSIDLGYDFNHLGLSLNTFSQVLTGRHPFCRKLKKAQKPLIIFGSNIKNLDSNYLNFLKKNLNKAEISFVNSRMGSYVVNELGLSSISKISPILNGPNNKSSTIVMVNTTKNINTIKIQNPNSFIVYIGTHYSVPDLKKVDMILPSALFLEKNSNYLSIEGRPQKTNKLRTFNNNCKEEWFILLSLLSYLSFKFSHNSNLNNIKDLDSLHTYYSKMYPFLNNGGLINTSHTVSNKGGSNAFLMNSFFKKEVKDFFCNDIMTKASKTMVSLSNKLKERKNNFSQ
jgi:NADH-quinone oxidoreductase chain G